MIHKNQMVAPISRRAMVHLNAGGYAAYAKNYIDNNKNVPLTEEEWNAKQETAATTQANAHMAYRPSTTQTIAENDTSMVSPQLIERYENEYASANDELAELAADGRGPGDPAYDKVLKKRDERKATLDQYNQQQALHDQTEAAQDIVSSDESVEASNLRNAHNVAVTTGDADLEASTIAKANEAGINLFGTGRQTLSDQSASGDYGFRAADVGVDVAKNEVLDKRAEDAVAQMGSATPYGQNTSEVIQAEVKEAAAKATAADKLKTEKWMKDTGLMDYLDPSQIANFMVNYLGSRLMGYDHGASAQFSMKQYQAGVEKLRSNRSASATKNEERAFELLKEGVITQDQYNTMVSTGRLPDLTGGSTTASGANIQSNILKAHGVDPKKATTKFVKSTADTPSGEIVEAWYGSGTYWIPDGKGGLKPLDITGYEKWTSEQHAEVNVGKNLRTSLTTFANEGGYSRTETTQDDDGKKVTRTVYDVNPTAFSTGYMNHLKATYGPNAYIYANTPAGRAEAQAYYTASVNFKRNTGKDITNWGGFFNAVNSGVYGADGHVNIELLATTPDGDPINMKNYTRMSGNMSAFRNKHPDIKTDGEAIKLAIDTFTNPVTDEEKALVARVKAMDIPAGSSPMMEFVNLYFIEG